MSREFDDILKRIDQTHKGLYKQDIENSKDIVSIKKDQEKLIKDIVEIKKEVKDIAFKVDTMLEILNSFTIMLSEDDGDIDDNYGIEESWISDDEWEDENDL